MLKGGLALGVCSLWEWVIGNTDGPLIEDA
jgi:hypothetical protein